MSFTLSDLTVREYEILARQIGADPELSFGSESSLIRGQVYAGILWLMDKRDGSTTPWENYRDLTLTEVLRRLGITTATTDAAPTHASALDAAREVTDLPELEDPTQARP